MSAEFPFNGLPPPAGATMPRWKYDKDNDGVVDLSKELQDQAGFRFRNGNVERLYPDGFWYVETPEIVDGSPVLSISLAPVQ